MRHLLAGAEYGVLLVGGMNYWVIYTRRKGSKVQLCTVRSTPYTPHQKGSDTS